MFSYHDEVVNLGKEILTIAGSLYSLRNHRLTLFYLSLSLLARARESSKDSKGRIIAIVMGYKQQIELWQSQCEVNYLMWSLLLEAEICELTGDYHNAIQAYERAIDHTQLYDFMLEQALAFELQGEFYIRRGAKRAARITLLEACALYSRISAPGKIAHVTAKHEFVLQSASTARTADAGVQTTDIIGDIGATHFNMEDHDRRETRKPGGQETSKERTSNWVSPTDPHAKISGSRLDVSNFGLDILDLQAILEFNQAISSELQLDLLLPKLTQISLEFTGAQADWAGIVIDSDDGWTLAASGTPDDIIASVSGQVVGSEDLPLIIIANVNFKYRGRD